MGQLVYILGRSGTGKSYSLRNFPADQVALINVQGKILPFRGSAAIEQTATDNSANIMKALDIYAHDYNSIVIDDYQYVMSNEFMRRSAEKGYDKFTEIARHAWDIANKVRELPDNVIVYIMCHTDRDDDGNEKIKTIGKLLDEKICLEGLSTIVLKTNVSDGQYTFLTQNNGKDTVKSPFGMFPTYAIDNDLWYVDQKIRNYYGMKGHMSDEAVKAMDEQVAKPEVKKDAAEGRRSRRKSASEVKETVEQEGLGTAEGQGTISKPAPSTESVAEGSATETEVKADTWTPDQGLEQPQQVAVPMEVARRRRKARNDQDKEEVNKEASAEEAKEEGSNESNADGTGEVDAEKPVKRRRRRTSDGFRDVVDLDDLPFY